MAKSVFYAISREVPGKGMKAAYLKERKEEDVFVIIDSVRGNEEPLKAALLAVEGACRAASSGDDIICDVEHIYDIVRSGQIKKWRFNGWTTSDGKKVAYSELWDSIYQLVRDNNLKVKLIKKNKKDKDKKYLRAVSLIGREDLP